LGVPVTSEAGQPAIFADLPDALFSRVPWTSVGAMPPTSGQSPVRADIRGLPPDGERISVPLSIFFDVCLSFNSSSDPRRETGSNPSFVRSFRFAYPAQSEQGFSVCLP
jgi:hypothetical protein